MVPAIYHKSNKLSKRYHKAQETKLYFYIQPDSSNNKL